ncbi:WD40/YVTN/BNR-like repeat-containing protein [Halocalculus aciditolerans]|uniref:Photosynthesis system II assembly factor Ycf48/Hcf136-like domain-containing protein n=1 Tax=Halocalculus aciditolerans TaxID=1383812 RepID=A0A830FBV4_9EURY|nr:hypothetical protein [Halocalculus aciditolerans]GGL59691.1 hypothetical protein GCM10009039_17410 [Halocalculus aciditolerans]
MPETPLSRRRFLAGTATVGAATVGAAAATAADSGGWASVSSPTGNALYDVVYADGRPWAVGSSGNLLERVDGSWRVASEHFAKKDKTLHAAATTDDETRVWAAGASGMVGSYDVDTGESVSEKKPVGNGNTFTDVVVVGDAGSERVFLAGPSGRVVVGEHDAAGELTWSLYRTGGGYAVNGLDFRSRDVGYAVTDGSTVFKTTDGGQSWKAIGIPNAQVPLFDVVARDESVYVSAGSGRFYRLDCACNLWTPFKTGSEQVSALTYRGDRFLGVGGSGRAYRKTNTGWTSVETPTGNRLNGVVPGERDDPARPSVAVGDSGTILEQ